MSRLEAAARVTYEVAKERALAHLDVYEPRPAGLIGAYIWPDGNMHAQGAGGAASRILKRMAAEGLVYWCVRDRNWGWCKK